MELEIVDETTKRRNRSLMRDSLLLAVISRSEAGMTWEIICASAALLGIGLLLKVLIKLLKYVFKILHDDGFDESLSKLDPHLHGVKYPVSYWSEKGARPYQEDRFHVLRGVFCTQPSMYGVFDGHGGHLAAQHCKDNLLQSIASDPDWELSPVKSITNSFHKY